MEATMVDPKCIQIEESWKKHLLGEFSKDYMQTLRTFLQDELQQKKLIFPHGSEIFSAFNLTPFDQVKVVIIGQDPYHGIGQAHGLCFSVKPGIPAPPSLLNIYKELASDVGFTAPTHGHLISWAKQGVLLLNAVLTVEKNRAGSHHGKGWEQFTDKVVDVLNREKENLVFILWGSPAQRKCAHVDGRRHLILKAPHPSPLSSYRGFFGCRHFSKTNQFLSEKNLPPIHWQLP
ncbi:MAG: uracil-DNA glycosylase [Oligoflexia bacterium]|nr:uracil-DNA glycosylase [Oligoflexia bacterium]MBF0364425.1 uracil-DNA glycosylase [Oligoflexia bacterium]